MKPSFVMTFIFCTILLTSLSLNDPDWRKLVPLQSTRADVERLLGPSEKDGYSADYKLDEGYLTIIYSGGGCVPGRTGGWNVPRDVVVSLSFSPKHKKRISALKLDRRKFRRVVDKHVGGVLYYINDEEGITYHVQRGRVDEIYYDPSSKHEHLYCGDPTEQKVPN
jgi:hypothetical protein